MPLAAGFVNLTSLQLRARGSVQGDDDVTEVQWHAKWGRRMTYTLRCLQHLTAPADGGTRCACPAPCSTLCMGARLERGGMMRLISASCRALTSAAHVLTAVMTPHHGKIEVVKGKACDALTNSFVWMSLTVCSVVAMCP